MPKITLRVRLLCLARGHYAEQNLRHVSRSPNAFKVAGHSLCPQRFAVTALPRQLQTLPCVPEFAQLDTQPLAMSWRAYHQVRREFDISERREDE